MKAIRLIFCIFAIAICAFTAEGVQGMRSHQYWCSFVNDDGTACIATTARNNRNTHLFVQLGTEQYQAVILYAKTPGEKGQKILNQPVRRDIQIRIDDRPIFYNRSLIEDTPEIIRLTFGGGLDQEFLVQSIRGDILRVKVFDNTIFRFSLQGFTSAFRRGMDLARQQGSYRLRPRPRSDDSYFPGNKARQRDSFYF